MELPQLPVPHGDVISYFASHSMSIHEAMQPFHQYESTLREIFAQDRQNAVLDEPNVNLVPIFDGQEDKFVTRARKLESETQEIKDRYVLQLPKADRRADGSLAVAPSFREFKKNFDVFSESAFADMDWSNVVVAGSAAVTPLLPVPKQHAVSKRALREYYHEKLAPASDVDMFLYGLNEEEAKKKIEQIEQRVRDSILYETTTVRTKYAITIASQYPCRHIQVVLRLYKNLSEILTSFDVDSACVAYDGKQVYATPRAIAAFMTQTNVTDLSRRSPSYENRLSKYSRRGFEIYCPTLDRSRIDPTIFERSFGRVLGLARLLVLEKLPSPSDRETYLTKRRKERGRPDLPWHARNRGGLGGNIKDEQPDEVAEWVAEEDVSNYSTFTVPYGPRFQAKNIEKLVFTKDLLLNAEWNRSKDRTVNLHRHPAFFGSAKDIFTDCCGSCPEPADEEEELVSEKEAEIYIKGPIKFIVDNPGRQQIGSFNPLTEDDWTEQAYVGNTQRLCQAIVDGDLEHVQDWCAQEGADVNRRDHTGRAPLHLAAQCSTPEVAQSLIDHGARITARIVDGRTALHIASLRGSVEIVKALIMKSDQNEEMEEERHGQRLKKLRAQMDVPEPTEEGSEDLEDLADSSDDDSDDEMTQGSFVRVKSKEIDAVDEDDAPDFYDPNILAWDYSMSPLHMAIAAGRVEVVRALVDTFGADVLLPVKIKDLYSEEPSAAILTLVLATRFAPNPAGVVRELIKCGASSAQADMKEISALHYVVNEKNETVFDLLLEYDAPAARAATRHIIVSNDMWRPTTRTPLLTAIENKDVTMVKKLLDNGAQVHIPQDTFIAAYQRNNKHQISRDTEQTKKMYQAMVIQPIVQAILSDQPTIARMLIEHGADVNTVNADALLSLMTNKDWPLRHETHAEIASALDLVRDRQVTFRNAVDGKLEQIPDIEELDADVEYLKGLDPESYHYWAVRAEVEHVKQVVEAMRCERDKELEELAKKGKLTQDRQDELKQTLEEFASVEALMLERGALTFHQMHPEKDDAPKEQHQNNHPWHRQRFDGPFKPNLNTIVPHLSEAKRNGYLALFEAAWTGNVELVKALTLAEWTPKTYGGPDDDEVNTPLVIAQQDSLGFTPFSIAVTRGHMELADAVLDIAMVQYRPRDNRPKYRYSLDKPDPDAEDEEDSTDNDRSDDDHFKLSKHLVDQRYTVESVAALQDTVESNTTPLDLIGLMAETHYLMPSAQAAQDAGLPVPNNNTHTGWNVEFDKYSQGHVRAVLANGGYRGRSTLFRYAIAKNNISLLKWLLDRETDYMIREEHEPDAKTRRTINRDDLLLCMRLGRIEMIGEVVEKAGVLLPIKRMVEKTGVEVKEKKQYYQGLTVYGRKRKDWADRSRGIVAYQDLSMDTPPLLDAAFNGSVEAVEYCLSGALLRRYETYVANQSNDPAIEALHQGKGGISKVMANWLNTRNQLAIHGAVMAKPSQDGKNKQLELLINALPHSIDGLNCARRTPLHVAFETHHLTAAGMLVKAGANQAARDSTGQNVLHHLVTGFHKQIVSEDSDRDYRTEIFGAFIGLLDPTLPEELLLQRSTHEEGSHTPLSYLLHSNRGSDHTGLLKAMLDLTKGQDLEIMDGSGDYPLHYLVRNGISWAARVVIEFNPALLRRENAVGLTPLEICEMSGLHDIIGNAPTIRDVSNGPRKEPPHLNDINIIKHQSEDLTTRDICVKAAAENVMPRKLVSLSDANEVAKRLAERHRNDDDQSHSRRTPRGIAQILKRYDYNQSAGADATDEVSDWRASASRETNWDLLRFLKGKGFDVDLDA